MCLRLPPGVNLDDLVGLDPQPQPFAFKTPLKGNDHDEQLPSDKPIDLDATDPIDLDPEDRLNAEISLICPEALPEESPFTFLYLSSEAYFEMMHLKILLHQILLLMISRNKV